MTTTAGDGIAGDVQVALATGNGAVEHEPEQRSCWMRSSPDSHCCRSETIRSTPRPFHRFSVHSPSQTAPG